MSGVNPMQAIEVSHLKRIYRAVIGAIKRNIKEIVALYWPVAKFATNKESDEFIGGIYARATNN